MAITYQGRTDLPLGLRNNNPGNLRPDGYTWQGQTGTANNFVVFENLDWGLRALATDISDKIQEGYGTIRQLITRYAPPSENDTAAYIAAVSGTTGLDPDTTLSFDAGTLHSLIRAITTHENGEEYASYIPDADIDTGIGMMNPNLLQLLEAGGIAVVSTAKTVPAWAWIGLLAGIWLVARE